MTADAIDIRTYLGHLEQTYELEPTAWNLPIKHWSPSSFAMLQRCPRQWQERYIHGRKERPAESPMIGTTVHHAVEVNFNQKISSHEDIPLAQLLDYYQSAFTPLVEQEQERAGLELQWDSSPESARKRGSQMLGAYQNIVAPRIQPLAVETMVSVDLGLPVPVEGRFDVEREESVIDLKTGRAPVRKPKEAWRIQAAVYGHAQSKAVEFHSVSASPKRGDPTIVTPLESEELLLHPNPAERVEQIRTLVALSQLACFYMATLGPDEPWPTFGRFHGWACDWCGYRGDCPAWRDT